MIINRVAAGMPQTVVATSALPSFASSRWSRADGWLLAYLFVPVPVFLLGFFSSWVGVPAAILAVAAFVASHPFGAADTPRWSRQLLVGALVLLVFAAAWTSLGGAGHIFHANAIRYNNQDRSMLPARLAVEAILLGRVDKREIWAVNVDDDYHDESR